MNKKLREIIKKVKEFNLEECSPSDDSDKKYAFVQNYKSLTESLKIWLDQIENDYVKNYLKEIDWNFECIQDAHQTKIKLDAIINFIEELETSDSDIILDKFKISQDKAIQIMQLKKDVVELLYNENAEILPDVCVSLGLREGDAEEANNGKRKYVYRRLLPLTPIDFLKILKEIGSRYPESAISSKIQKILEVNSLKITNNFDEILKKILIELERAEYTIWIAMAWLTNLELLRILYKKKTQGLNIQLIVNNDDINNNVKGPKGEKIIDYFEVYKNDDTRNLMHNKFCIIDLKKVITGSYNWTNKAQYNDENIVLIEDIVTAQKYADNFKEIKVKIMRK